MERKLAAILSADVEGYSRLMGDDELATVRAITENRQVIASAVTGHGGRVVDAPGDNVLAEFASVVDAVQSAVEINKLSEPYIRRRAIRHLERGRVVEFYAELAEILKRYAGRRFEVPYLERTTAEIFGDLGRAGVREAWIDKLASLLSTCDLVKFARFHPHGDTSRTMLPDAFSFVDATRPRPPARAARATISGRR